MSEVKRFFERAASFPKDKKGKVHFSRVKDMLKNQLYSGYLSKADWGIHLLKGKHDPLISFETYQRIQDRLQMHAKAPARKNINKDFPLRGFVNCGCCGQPMTSCWTKGRSATYPYYLCKTKGCTSQNKSIRGETLESEFEALLNDLKPSVPVFITAATMFTDMWNEKREQVKLEAHDIRKQVLQIERKSDQLLERIVEADNLTIISAYENKLRKLEEEKITLDENIAKCGRPLQSFDDTFRTAFSFLSNPQKLWASGRLEHQRMVLKLVFTDKLDYDRNEGFRTAPTALPLSLLAHMSDPKSEMVEGAGFEPA